MVAAEKQTSPAVTGCVQVFAARERRAALSSPRGGGALSSAPTTEKRKRAHKAAVDRSVFRVIKSPHGWGERGDNPTMNRPAGMVEEHLLRAAGGHLESSIARPPGMVIGARKRSSCSHSPRGSLPTRKASWRARGSAATSIARAKRCGRPSRTVFEESAHATRPASARWSGDRRRRDRRVRACSAVRAPAAWLPPRRSRRPDTPSGQGTVSRAALPACGNHLDHSTDSTGNNTPWEDPRDRREGSEDSARSASDHCRHTPSRAVLASSWSINRRNDQNLASRSKS